MATQFPNFVFELETLFESHGAHAYLVGGCVRDWVLALPISDIDIEVYGNESLTQLRQVLGKRWPSKIVGKSFAVLTTRIAGISCDISLPRTDHKIGPGHRGFEIKVDANLSFEAAASRRDFTMNSMGFDLRNQQLIDPFHGVRDLQNGILRATSSAFSEDPLRVFRAMRFAARFALEIAPETLQMCREMPITELSRERIYLEIRVLLLSASRPSLGLRFASALGLSELFQVLHIDTPAWTEVLNVVDEMARHRFQDERNKLVLMLGALCHRIDAPGECESFLSRLAFPVVMRRAVAGLVSCVQQMMTRGSRQVDFSDADLRRFSTQAKLEDAFALAEAIRIGTGAHRPSFLLLRDRAEALGILESPPVPMLTGALLMKWGYRPGPHFGGWISGAYDLQLEGKFLDVSEIRSWLEGLPPS